jgi:ankyrin repeat protein
MGKAKSGSTLLHEATLNGHSEVVAWLLDAGADVEAETDGGRRFIWPCGMAMSLLFINCWNVIEIF